LYNIRKEKQKQIHGTCYYYYNLRIQKISNFREKKNMIKGFIEEENMSNLTSASGEASANSSGNRNEIGTNNYHQQYLAPSQSTQIHDEAPPPKKRRNLPGNPGLLS
jgi:hypothetical protein